MNTRYYDLEATDDERRALLYNGHLLTYSPTPGSLALIQHARALAEAAFAPLDPRTAQHHMSVEDYAKVLAVLKPEFIHHPRSKSCIQRMLFELGCDLEQTYFDVPRLRNSTAQGYLTTGIPNAQGRPWAIICVGETCSMSRLNLFTSTGKGSITAIAPIAVAVRNGILF